MNKSIKVKELEIGQGMPKICVSIIGRNHEEIIEAAKRYKELDIDIVEWRADYYNEVQDSLKVRELLSEINNILDNKPIIFTFRTKEEGGEKKITKEEYCLINKEIIAAKLTDFIDLELYTGEKEVKELIKCSHVNGIKVIVSNHDFKKTPSENEIYERLDKMIMLGADIPKIAVMPNNQEDVLKLMSASSRIKKEYDNQPIITMSMGSLGIISRLSGEIFGSAVTFGCVDDASAPGQINYQELRKVILIIHKNI